MRYVMIILCIISFGGCRRSPEMKWYHHVLDSLGRIEAPLKIDTVLFNRQLGGREKMDTIISDMVIRQSRDYWGNRNYSSLQWHKDSLIGNLYEYDGADGKLISWSRHFVIQREYVYHGSIVDYTKWYKKNGKIETFGAFSAKEIGDPSPMPSFTIYHLIERLKKEGVDVFNNVYIASMPANSGEMHFGKISYPKYNWKVGVFHYDNDALKRGYHVGSAHWREFDSDTGEVIKEWKERFGPE